MGSSADDLPPRHTGLDSARALAISLVLVWHLQPFKTSIVGHPHGLIRTLDIILLVFYWQVTLLGVPVFLLVSLYLAHRKIGVRPLEYLKRRCCRIGGVFLFWTTCQFAFFYGMVVLGSAYEKGIGFLSTTPIQRILMEGGPPLPIVGGSVFYFLFVLLVLVVVSAGFLAAANNQRMFQYMMAAGLVVSLWYFEILNLSQRCLPYWRIDNFLIYIPLSYFLVVQEKRFLRYVPWYYLGFIVFSAQDVYLHFQGVQCAAYSRVSIVFGSVAVLGSILRLKDLRQVTFIHLLSRYSLGMFATHKYWQLIVIVGLQRLGLPGMVQPKGFPLELGTLIISVVAVVLTFIGVLLASRTPVRRFFMSTT